MSDSSRFDPEKVEWPGEPTHPSYSTAPGPDSAGNISMELGPGYQVVPAYAYTELYEVAEQGDKLLEQARDLIAAIVCEPEHEREANNQIEGIETQIANFRGTNE